MSTASDLLASVESAISYRLGRIAAGDYLSHSFAGKSFTEYSLQELMDIRDRLKAEVSSEGTGYGGIKLQKFQAGGMN